MKEVEKNKDMIKNIGKRKQTNTAQSLVIQVNGDYRSVPFSKFLFIINVLLFLFKYLHLTYWFNFHMVRLG